MAAIAVALILAFLTSNHRLIVQRPVDTVGAFASTVFSERCEVDPGYVPEWPGKWIRLYPEHMNMNPVFVGNVTKGSTSSCLFAKIRYVYKNRSISDSNWTPLVWNAGQIATLYYCSIIFTTLSILFGIVLVGLACIWLNKYRYK